MIKLPRLYKLPPIDSLNVWPLISGQNSTSPWVDIPLTQNTLISGQYKILTGNVDLAGWTGPVYPNTIKPSGISAIEHCGDSGCLYNIIDDPEEYTNLAEKMPDVLKEMQAKLIIKPRAHVSLQIEVQFHQQLVRLHLMCIMDFGGLLFLEM